MAPTAKKAEEAKALILECIGRNGLWADSTRYRWQCWTRDFALAGMPAMLLLGRTKEVWTHLAHLIKKVREDGRVPILFLDDELSFLREKVGKSVREGRVSFMLQRYLEKGSESLEMLTPWTKDSEILYTIVWAWYFQLAGMPPVDASRLEWPKAPIHYVEKNLMRDGLAVGGDWRDTMVGLEDKQLLTNNCLLHRAYRLLGPAAATRADLLKDRINRAFWTGSYYRDYLGTETFDTLGQAMAVLYDVAPPERWPSVIAKFAEADSPFGHKTNNVVPKPVTPGEAAVIDRTNQYGVVWPFIHGFAILALLKMGRRDLAEAAFDKWEKLEGFWEWYDPDNGNGFGASRQMWSASFYLQAARALGRW